MSESFFLRGLRRIMCRASIQTPHTTSSVHPDTESFAEKVAVSAAFLGCVVILMFLG